MPTTRDNKKNRVVIQYAVPRRGLPSPAMLRKWAHAASAAAITLRIVGEREGRRLNGTFRKKRSATNVLTFSYDKNRGDLVLCHPVIRREARAQGKSIAAHYAHLVVHGCLHLRGYDHEKKRDAARMEAREIGILRRIGIRDPYTVE
ncbi:MAG TPA: rRNA maturation RNase YbeY [Burkholderiales bacterium]|nr:rRNA maturation RNase YbeY [Burkholderiales bacterium]